MTSGKDYDMKVRVKNKNHPLYNEVHEVLYIDNGDYVIKSGIYSITLYREECEVLK